MSYKCLGDYIEQYDLRSKDLQEPLSISDIKGISSISKSFIKTRANLVGVKPDKYKVVNKNCFAFNPNTARMGDRIPIALNLTSYSILVSSIYPTYKVNKKKLLPEYLMMWFKRPEFDRYARYKSHGSAREIFDFEEMCNVELPIPTLEKQQQIVSEYNTVTNRIDLNNQLNQKLEATAQALYKHWFVDFEFSNADGKPYKSSGGKMVYNEELDKDIPVGWSVERLEGNLKYSKNRIEINKLDKTNYISTENMLKEKKGITEANSLPTANTVTKFNSGNILISNIRPYFKKIWLASYEGGCSNDVLCFDSTLEDSLFFYYTLEQDSFFEYIMQGAKGTKMPRGDKDWIMNYYYPKSKNKLELKYSNTVNQLNGRICSNRQQSQTLQELQSLLLAKMTKVEAEKEMV